MKAFNEKIASLENANEALLTEVSELKLALEAAAIVRDELRSLRDVSATIGASKLNDTEKQREQLECELADTKQRLDRKGRQLQKMLMELQTLKTSAVEMRSFTCVNCKIYRKVGMRLKCGDRMCFTCYGKNRYSCPLG